MVTTFKKFGSTPDVLRDHILSYCENPTLFNYSLCSKKCNREIQRFNTIAPKKIKLDYNERIRKTVVTLTYQNETSYIRRCEPVTKLDYGIGEAARILEKSLKYVKSMDSTVLAISTKKWPSEVMELQKIKEVSSLRIEINRGNYKALLDFLNKSQIKRLMLCRIDAQNSNFTIPNAFFKSEGFRKLDKAFIYANSKIDEQDFLEYRGRLLSVTTTMIGAEAMNKKIRQWYESESPFDVNYEINNDANQDYDYGVIIRGLPFTEEGDVERPDGKIGKLNFDRESSMSFFTSDTAFNTMT